jgi:hypothetical protein
MRAQGIIRKINIGDIKDGMTYKVGQEMMGGRLMIKTIMYDTDTQLNTGDRKYDVYVMERGSDNVRLWKSFINVPTSIEYDISIEKDVESN